MSGFEVALGFEVVDIKKTGIYTSYTIRFHGRDQDSDMTYEDFVRVSEDETFVSLEQAREMMRTVLKRHGVTFDSSGIPEFLTSSDGMPCFASIPDATTDFPEEVFDAADALKLLNHLEPEASLLAIAAGRLLERVLVRAYEPLAKTGRKVKAGAADGGKARTRTDADKLAELREFEAALASYRRKHPGTKAYIVFARAGVPKSRYYRLKRELRKSRAKK